MDIERSAVDHALANFKPTSFVKAVLYTITILIGIIAIVLLNGGFASSAEAATLCSNCVNSNVNTYSPTNTNTNTNTNNPTFNNRPTFNNNPTNTFNPRNNVDVRNTNNFNPRIEQNVTTPDRIVVVPTGAFGAGGVSPGMFGKDGYAGHCYLARKRQRWDSMPCSFEDELADRAAGINPGTEHKPR